MCVGRDKGCVWTVPERRLEDSVTVMLLPLRQKRTGASLCGTAPTRAEITTSFPSGKELTSVTCVRQKAAEQAWTFTLTLPVKMNDYLGGRAVESQFGTQTPSVPQHLHAGPQAFMRRSLGCSKCKIVKILPAVSLHCNFCSVAWNSLRLNCCHSSSAATPTREKTCFYMSLNLYRCRQRSPSCNQHELINNIIAPGYDITLYVIPVALRRLQTRWSERTAASVL